jgi:hypothetical protein
MSVKAKSSVPKDLEFLLPEKVCQPIVIGDLAFDLYPLTEGEFETLSMEVSKLFDVVFIKGEMSPIDYLMQKNVLAAMLSEALKPLPVDEIKSKLTAKQMMYAASVLWKMNFETTDFNEESLGNFKKVLGWIGLGAMMPQAPAQLQPVQTADQAAADKPQSP